MWKKRSTTQEKAKVKTPVSKGPSIADSIISGLPGQIIHLAKKGAVKFDRGKPDFSHITYELLEEVSRVREFGAKKYTRGNWKKGFLVTRSIAAALRHLFLFLGGQTNDEESGLSHLGHAVCCIEHAMHDMKYRPENDDREAV